MQKLFDIHTHIFPEKIAQKAVYGIDDFYGFDRNASHNGRKSDLLFHLSDGFDGYALTFSVATVPHQVTAINDFISLAVKDEPRLIAYGTLHPDFENVEQEAERIKSLGLLGIKLHPDFQKFYIDCPEALPIYKKAQELSLPVYFHAGDNRYEYSAPERIARIMDMFPDLTVIAAHLGGYARWEDAEKYLRGGRVYYDTSSAVCFLEPERAAEIIRGHGADKVFFGTDYPLKCQKDEWELVSKLPLTDEEKELIFYKNAEKFFNLRW